MMSEDPPLVHRPVRTGGLLLALGSLQFIVVLFAVAMRYPAFSFSHDAILSLGGSASPWGWVFNGSLAAFGLLALVGLLLVFSAYDGRPTRGAAFLLLVAAALGAIGLAVVSETSLGSGTDAARIALYVSLVGAIAGLFVLSDVMHRAERWYASRPYTLATATVMAVAAGLLGTGYHLGLGLGTLDWLVAAPALVWPIAEGVHIALLHRYAPGLLVKAASA